MRVFWQMLLDGILRSTVAFAGAVPLARTIVRAVRESLVTGAYASQRPLIATSTAG